MVNNRSQFTQTSKLKQMSKILYLSVITMLDGVYILCQFISLLYSSNPFSFLAIFPAILLMLDARAYTFIFTQRQDDKFSQSWSDNNRFLLIIICLKSNENFTRIIPSNTNIRKIDEFLSFETERAGSN
jgi:hypothetical protein